MAPISVYPQEARSSPAGPRRAGTGNADLTVGTARAQRGGRDEPQTGGKVLPSRRIGPGGPATRRQGNADLWSAQPRGSAAGETNLKQRDGSHLRVSPPGTATRRQGNADLRSAQPRAARRARRTSNGGMAPVSAYPHQARRRAGKGTPTSGRHSRAQLSSDTQFGPDKRHLLCHSRRGLLRRREGLSAEAGGRW